jgi:hypothetical protein
MACVEQEGCVQKRKEIVVSRLEDRERLVRSDSVPIENPLGETVPVRHGAEYTKRGKSPRRDVVGKYGLAAARASNLWR